MKPIFALIMMAIAWFVLYNWIIGPLKDGIKEMRYQALAGEAKDLLQFSDHVLTVQKRDSVIAELICVVTGKRLKTGYEPEKIHIGAATVGGVTTGGVYKTGGYKYIAGTEKNGKFELHFASSNLEYASQINTIQLTPELYEEALQSDDIRPYLNKSGQIVVVQSMPVSDAARTLAMQGEYYMINREQEPGYPTLEKCQKIVAWLSQHTAEDIRVGTAPSQERLDPKAHSKTGSMFLLMAVLGVFEFLMGTIITKVGLLPSRMISRYFKALSVAFSLLFEINATTIFTWITIAACLGITAAAWTKHRSKMVPALLWVLTIAQIVLALIPLAPLNLETRLVNKTLGTLSVGCDLLAYLLLSITVTWLAVKRGSPNMWRLPAYCFGIAYLLSAARPLVSPWFDTFDWFFIVVCVIFGVVKYCSTIAICRWFAADESNMAKGKTSAKQKPQKAPAKPEISDRSMEELKRCKELLELGVITQEEFDEKKKQLLGL